MCVTIVQGTSLEGRSVNPELAAKLEAATCRLTAGPNPPVHLTRAFLTDLLEQKARVADTLQWLRRELAEDSSLERTVRAREVWNRLTTEYFDPVNLSPDEQASI